MDVEPPRANDPASRARDALVTHNAIRKEAGKRKQSEEATNWWWLVCCCFSEIPITVGAFAYAPETAIQVVYLSSNLPAFLRSVWGEDIPSRVHTCSPDVFDADVNKRARAIHQSLLQRALGGLDPYSRLVRNQWGIFILPAMLCIFAALFLHMFPTKYTCFFAGASKAYFFLFPAYLAIKKHRNAISTSSVLKFFRSFMLVLIFSVYWLCALVASDVLLLADSNDDPALVGWLAVVLPSLVIAVFSVVDTSLCTSKKWADDPLAKAIQKFLKDRPVTEFVDLRKTNSIVDKLAFVLGDDDAFPWFVAQFPQSSIELTHASTFASTQAVAAARADIAAGAANAANAANAAGAADAI